MIRLSHQVMPEYRKKMHSLIPAPITAIGAALGFVDPVPENIIWAPLYVFEVYCNVCGHLVKKIESMRSTTTQSYECPFCKSVNRGN